MKNRVWLIVLMMVCLVATTQAQQMTVEDYAHIKRPLWKHKSVVIDKQHALLDLYTTEKGFSFTANGKEPVEVEEGDGKLTLKLPHQTRYVTIKHEVYGQYTWRVPVKYLKRKKRYRATLLASDPTKQYKLSKQWVVMDISPRNAIVQMDSVRQMVRNGKAAFNLPLGTHQYQVESPFYQAVRDSFQLTDTMKVEMTISLQPVYSYITVDTPWTNGDIYVDGSLIGRMKGTSGRLAEGQHQLSVFLYDYCCYDETFTIGVGEKKVYALTAKDFNPQPSRKRQAVAVSNGVQSDTLATVAHPEDLCTVTLLADSIDTEIWVDRELKGKGQWSGPLELGYHQVVTKRDSLESEPYGLWLNDNFPQTLNLEAPQTSVGMVNVYSNVVGATIYVDDVLKGVTPMVISGLSPRRNYTVLVTKDGYSRVKKHVRPRGNELTNLYINMKKK